MKFQIHEAIGHDATLIPAPLNTHEAAHEFTDTLARLLQVEPARVIHDEYRTAEYVWTNVTVSLPLVGEAVFSVDSRKTACEAVRLYLDNKAVPFAWAGGANVGRILAGAVVAAVRQRDAARRAERPRGGGARPLGPFRKRALGGGRLH
ncbi:hypothetical protein ID875_20935 [Streptomyces globisporus]|uniref:Uncharacterized protein n=1 Tax=Streptomyces globisporus TaxID=1908 RepID=A0A927BN64_STRGL|nr:hypothetical protein [Streptomyces globisporus]